MQLATLEQQKVAMLAIIRQLEQQGINLESVAEGAKLQILGSVELCTYPAHYRVNCASAVDGLILEALEPPAVDI